VNVIETSNSRLEVKRIGKSLQRKVRKSVEAKGSRGVLKRFGGKNQNDTRRSSSRGRLNKVFFVTSTETCCKRES
jgi:hypothetical protein